MLILVRHGESVANARGLLVGRTDSELTDRGLEQARRIGGALAAGWTDARPVRIVSSPLVRTRLTAGEIARAFGGLEVGIDERLIELDYGELEGQRPADLAGGVWAEWRSDASFRPPGGESLPDLEVRLESFWESVRDEAKSGDVIAVTHVSPIKAGVAWVLGAGPELSWKLSLGVASITRVSTAGPGPALVSFGETGHLMGL